MGYFSEGTSAPSVSVGNRAPQFQDISSAAREAEANDPLRVAIGAAGDAADERTERLEREERERKAALAAKGLPDTQTQKKDTGFFSKLFGG